MNNLDIRIMVSNNDLRYKDIADEMNITPEWLSRLMRHTLTTDNKIRIYHAINALIDRQKKE